MYIVYVIVRIHICTGHYVIFMYLYSDAYMSLNVCTHVYIILVYKSMRIMHMCISILIQYTGMRTTRVDTSIVGVLVYNNTHMHTHIYIYIYIYIYDSHTNV